MSDDLEGEDGGYTPCDDAPSAPVLADVDGNAIAGEDGGYAVPGNLAASPPSDETDTVALYGQSVGFVAKPCEAPCAETFDRVSPTDLGVSTLAGDLEWQNDTVNCEVNGTEAILTDDAAPYLQIDLGAPLELLIHQVLEPGAFVAGSFPFIDAAVQLFETDAPNTVGQMWCGYGFVIVNSGGPLLRLQTKSYSPIGGVTLTSNSDLFAGDATGLLIKTRMRIENISPTTGLLKVKAWMGSDSEPSDWTAVQNSQGLDAMGSLRLIIASTGGITTARFRIKFFRFSEGFDCRD